MRNPLLCLLCVVAVALPASAQDSASEKLDKLGLSFELEDGAGKVQECFQAKDYDGALVALQAQLALLKRAEADVPQAWLNRQEAGVRYDMACARARLGKAEAALNEFTRAVELGFWRWDHLARDPDLDSIRDRPEFSAAVEAGKKAEAAALAKRAAAAVAEVERSLAEGPLVSDYALHGELLGGGEFGLEPWKGKVVVVAHFWGAAMEPPQALRLFPELRHMQALSAELKDAPVAWVAAAFKTVTDPDGEGAKAIAEAAKVSFPVVRIEPDQVKLDGKLLVLDREGQVRAALSKPHPKVLRAVIDRLLR